MPTRWHSAKMSAAACSWAAVNGIIDRLAEMCLAHFNCDRIEAACRRAKMIMACRLALQDWADYMAN